MLETDECYSRPAPRQDTKMCRPLDIDGTCTNTLDWLCPNEDASGGGRGHSTASQDATHANRAPATPAGDAAAPTAGVLPERFGMLGALVAVAVLVVCVAGGLVIARVYMLRRRIGLAKGAPRAKHTRIGQDEMPGAREEGHGDGEDDEPPDDDIIGDDEMARPVPRRYSGGMPLPGADEPEPERAAKDPRGEPDSPSPGLLTPKQEEDELLKRVAELLKDQPV